MADVFTKLNLKDHSEIVVLNAPASFEQELATLDGPTIRRSLDGLQHIVFALAFVTKLAEVNDVARAIAGRAEGDAIIWFAYPKASSQKYSCEFNRDTGWTVMDELGFKGVRQVAIDEDWSALRFRRVEFTKTKKRERRRS